MQPAVCTKICACLNEKRMNFNRVWMRFVSSEPLSHCSSFFIFLFPDITIANVSRMKKNLSNKVIGCCFLLNSSSRSIFSGVLTVSGGTAFVAAIETLYSRISFSIVCACLFSHNVCVLRERWSSVGFFLLNSSLSLLEPRAHNLPVCLSPDNRFRICTRIRAAMQCCKCSQANVC